MDETLVLECEEPDCRFPATDDWHGRKVCRDCWERWKEKEEKMYSHMRQ